MSPSISAFGTRAATESISDQIDRARAGQASAISSACSPQSGCDIKSDFRSMPMPARIQQVEGVLGVDECRDAAGLLRLGDGVQG